MKLGKPDNKTWQSAVFDNLSAQQTAINNARFADVVLLKDNMTILKQVFRDNGFEHYVHEWEMGCEFSN